MKAETFKFNKEDWSGEMAEIKATEFAGTIEWSQNGYDLSLRGKKSYDDWVMWEIFEGERRTGHKVGKFEDDALWAATNECGDMDRLGSHPVVAAARLMFNLL